MTYAAEGQISQSPIEGGVEINMEQYAAALEGMLSGKLVTIAGGFAVIDPPEAEPEPEMEPEPSLPSVVSSRQFFLQLSASGLTTAVEAWVATQADPIQIAYNKSATFHRDDPMLQAGFAGLGVTTEQIDAFFVAASAL